MVSVCFLSFFFFNDTATTEIYTLSLHDALPISGHAGVGDGHHAQPRVLDLRLDRGGDDLADAHRELAGAGRVGHGTSWCRAPRAGRDAGGAGRWVASLQGPTASLRAVEGEGSFFNRCR